MADEKSRADRAAHAGRAMQQLGCSLSIGCLGLAVLVFFALWLVGLARS